MDVVHWQPDSELHLWIPLSVPLAAGTWKQPPGPGRRSPQWCRWGRPGSSARAAASNGGCREVEERRACEGPRGWWVLYAQLGQLICTMALWWACYHPAKYNKFGSLSAEEAQVTVLPASPASTLHQNQTVAFKERDFNQVPTCRSPTHSGAECTRGRPCRPDALTDLRTGSNHTLLQLSNRLPPSALLPA